MLIVVAGDDKYFNGLVVTIYSAWANNPGARFSIVDNGLSSANIDVLKLLTTRLAVDLNVIKPSDELIETLPRDGRLTSTAYARLLIPDLFPDEPRAIYLDTDIVVDSELSKLWSIDLDGKLIGAMADGFIREEELENTGMSHSTYVNSGVLVMNLELWRAERVLEQIFGYARSGAAMLYMDQTAINVATKGRVAFVPIDYNFFTERLNDLPLSKPRIYHYAGTFKPWLYWETPLGFIYRHYASALIQKAALALSLVPKKKIPVKNIRRTVVGLLLLRKKHINKLKRSMHHRQEFKSRRRTEVGGASWS